MESKSEIRQFFSGKNVFITGATGFLGKLLVEKLLRSCDVSKVYILIRSKKGKSEKERYNEIFQVPMFEPLRNQQPNFLDKVAMVLGDCSLPSLGLSQFDLDFLKVEINIIFHCAATVRFDQTLRTAAYINIRATKDLIEIAKNMTQLKAFVHVSTAYSNCHRKDIHEVYYKPRISTSNLFALLDMFDDELIDDFTPSLLGRVPNTYILTKAMAETVVKTDACDLPVAVLRPSIVISTYKEPVPGWIDNYYGPVGVAHGAALGLIRTLHAEPENKADIIPADYVINGMIAAAWQASERHIAANGDEQAVPIYNHVSTVEAPINWRTYTDKCYEYGRLVPSPLIVWHSIFTLTRYKWKHNLALFFLHWIPAYIIDFIAICIGRKPLLVEGYKKIHKFISVISYFTTREWNFSNKNTQTLWRKLNPVDQQIFEFSVTKLNWEEFFSTFFIGGRIYLAKDPLETVPAGRRKALILRIAHYTLVTILCLLMYKILVEAINLF